MLLVCDVTRGQVYLLGTAHVSERSERAVRQVISAGHSAQQ
jgi:pheromone shutdown protein TraB